MKAPKLVVNNGYVEVYLKNDIYKSDRTGKDKLVKRGVLGCRLINLEKREMSVPGHILNSRGSIIKNECSVYIRELGFVVLAHSYEEVRDVLLNYEKPSISTKLGFDISEKSKGSKKKK